MANDAILNKEAEEKDNARFKELKAKKAEELTVEEKTELGDLKDRHSDRVQKRIDTVVAKQKIAEEEVERLKKENEELKNKIPEKKEDISDSLKGEIVEIAGKKYFTDKALLSQIKAGEITEDEALSYQKKRDKEELKFEIKQEQETETKKKEADSIRGKDIEGILEKYPQFRKDHPDFNQEDPLYKLANEIYVEGYVSNPKGMSLAIKRAKEILRISDKEIDRSEDHGMDSSNPPDRNSNTKEITLTEDEKESAVRMYTRGDVMNPKTGRPYTVNEAIAKGLAAKKSRRI
jgi:trichohyalin